MNAARIAIILLWIVRIAFALAIVIPVLTGVRILSEGVAFPDDGSSEQREIIAHVINLINALSIGWAFIGLTVSTIAWIGSAMKKLPTRSWKRLFWWSTSTIAVFVFLFALLRFLVSSIV